MPTAAAQESLDFTRDVQSSTRQDHGFTVLSLYTGAGGLDLGFLQTGFKVLMSVEHNKWAASTYAALESRTVDDNRSVAVGDIDDNKGQIFATFPDVVIGGPPCQSFSVVGKMDPNDPRARHVRLFLDIVDRLQPLAFVMENVDALMNNNRWSALLQQLHRKAVAAGYNTSVVVLNSEYYGVPQARRRFFLIGSKTTTVKVPPETTPSKSITVREAFASLSVCGSPGNDTLCKAKIVPSLNPDLRRSPYAGILFNGPGRPLCLDAPSQTLPASMGGQRHAYSGSTISRNRMRKLDRNVPPPSQKRRYSI